MISRKSFYGIGLIGMMLGFFGCIGENVGNKSSAESFAVITYNSEAGKVVMNTSGGAFIPNPSTGLEDGDCIYTTFMIDYDHQPADSKFPEATEVQYQQLNHSTVIRASESIDEEYNDSIKGLEIYPYNQFFKGYVFLQTSIEAPTKQQYRNIMVYYPDSIETNGSPAVFVKAKKSNEATGTNTTVYTTEAFNLNPILRDYGRDTIIIDGYQQEISCRYVKLNVKYQSGTVNGKPVYKRSGTGPTLFVFEK